MKKASQVLEALALKTFILHPSSLILFLVGPTGLKPAPHGLKVRCSVARAPGQEDCQLPISDCRFLLCFERTFR